MKQGRSADDVRIAKPFSDVAKNHLRVALVSGDSDSGKLVSAIWTRVGDAADGDGRRVSPGWPGCAPGALIPPRWVEGSTSLCMRTNSQGTFSLRFCVAKVADDCV